MRVLQILHGKEAGGHLTLAEIIGAELAKRGFELESAHLFARFDTAMPAKVIGTLQVAGRILFGRYDAVITYQPSASILAGVVGAIARCPRRIVHQTNLPDEIKQLMRWLDRVAGTLGLYTVNVANSTTTLKAFSRYPGRYRRSMMLIEHGVETTRPIRNRAATLARFDIPDEGCLTLNVGRLSAQKNQGVLIQALPELPGHRLIVAGEGALRGEYQAMAARLGVQKRLHLLGDVSRQDVADLLHAADVFAFPSTWETFGLAVVEAALAGLPLVASELPVLREVLSSGHATAATFVPATDPKAWARAIAECRPSSTAECGKIAAALATRYSITRMIDAYFAILVPNADSAH
jgi:glycosyltransferase involved in cell wall biosynthesis